MENTRNKLVRLNIDKITIPELSIKDFDYLNFERLKKSISKNGQIKNIVICETELGFECIDGGKILQALKELGSKTVIAFNLGVLSEDEKKQVRLEIFRDYFQTNYVNIGLLIKEISKNLDLNKVCNYIPFDVTQAEHLSKMSDFDWAEFSQNKSLGQVDMFSLIEETLTETNEDLVEELNEVEKTEDNELTFDLTKLSETVETELEVKDEKENIEEVLTNTFDLTNTIIKEEVLENIEKEKLDENLSKNEFQFKVDDIGYYKTMKGDVKIQITKITDKWVIFNELETNKRKDCLISAFNDKFTKIIIAETKKEETQIILDNEDYLFDVENKKLIIKRNLGENFDEVKKVCRYLATNKYEFNQSIIKDETYTYNTVENHLEITSCKLVDRFDVPRFIPLLLIAENLIK